ncbi:MAG: HAMP domain-containing protein [Treponema sp.]|nr:HAMP domain-containing protein [Treponema sp.]
MAKKGKIRITLTVKLLILFLAVLFVANITFGEVAYQEASSGMEKNVQNQIETFSTDVVHQLKAINDRHFQTLHSIAELAVMKDESISLADKQNQLTRVAAAIGENIQNMAFYDAEGNAITADGRLINFATRPYFMESFAGNDFMSDPAYSTVTDSVLQHYGVPVYNENKKAIGAIVMVVSGNTILSTIEKIDMGGGMHPTVVNYIDNTIVANANVEENPDATEEEKTEAEKKNEELAKMIADLFKGKEDIKDFNDPDTKEHLIASYRQIPNTKWAVFAFAPYNYYYGSLKDMQRSLTYVNLITLLLAAVIVIVLVRLLVKPLKKVKNSIETIASGNADLTQRIPEATNDEIGDVVKGFNSFVEKLQGIVTNLQTSKNNLITVDNDLQSRTQDTSTSITEIISNIEGVNKQINSQSDYVTETADAVNQISSNIDSLEKMIQSQVSCVSEASAAVEQMIGNINSVNTSVGKMISSFSTLQHHSNEGFNTQSNANEKIMRIDEQSKMLQDANTAIASIAEQTNLLAMNAAIEAAHAGEAGKGFAVVADEIRKLSETSTTQSKTIGSELQKIQETIRDVVTVSNETNTAFSAITNSISETSQIIEQIKAAMEEQQIGSKQIIDALQSMNDSTSEVHTASGEMTEGNRHILEEIQKLQVSTDSVKQSIENMHSGAVKINETGSLLSDISGKMADNIRQIGTEIDLFKI